jgi:two-component system NtrC family sensor kinase
MPNGGTLTIMSARRGEHATISITNTGHGIKKENLSQIFEPFFTTKPVGKGTGLGLAVSHGIVEQHGGVIEVESEVDRGSGFTIVRSIAGDQEATDAAPDGSAGKSPQTGGKADG